MGQLKLYAQIRSPHETRKQWTTAERLKEDGWYELEREPGIDEYLEYDEQNDCIVIRKREKSAEQLEAERKMAIRMQLIDELPDIILQNKDDPEILIQALCARAKQIETETTNDLERNQKAI